MTTTLALIGIVMFIISCIVSYLLWVVGSAWLLVKGYREVRQVQREQSKQ